MDRIRQMEVFIQVMESGNFTRAATVLGLPRSTVSTLIQNLEDHLGTQLLRRSTRQMVPTDEGHEFLRIAREITDVVGDAEQMFRQTPCGIRGRLRIDMPSRIGRRFVIPALPTLLEQFPDLTIELSTTDRMVDLISEGVDCLIRVGTLQDSGVICRRLGDLQMLTCASPAYIARFGMPETVGCLTGHRMVNFGSSLPAEPANFDYQDAGGTVSIPMASVISVNNAEAYITAAIAGLGMIRVPAFDVRDLMKRGLLVPVLPQLRTTPMQLSLLYARRRNVPTRIAVFQKWVGALLQAQGVLD